MEPGHSGGQRIILSSISGGPGVGGARSGGRGARVGGAPLRTGGLGRHASAHHRRSFDPEVSVGRVAVIGRLAGGGKY